MTRVDLAVDSLIAGFAMARDRPVDYVDTCSFILAKATVAQYAICGKPACNAQIRQAPQYSVAWRHLARTNRHIDSWSIHTLYAGRKNNKNRLDIFVKKE